MKIATKIAKNRCFTLSILIAALAWHTTEASIPKPQKTECDTLLGTSYYVTNRSFYEIKDIYDSVTPDFNALNLSALAQKKVLDAGCGTEGAFVRHLIRAGIDAYGIDLFFDEAATGPYITAVPPGHLVKGDMKKMPFPDEYFDVIYTTLSILSPIYEGNNPITVYEVLQEFKRTLKKGGHIRILSGNRLLISALLPLIGNLKISNSLANALRARKYYIEIEKF